ncbi:MAG: lipoyl synthase [Candidatus Woesearchaeota archaeon]
MNNQNITSVWKIQSYDKNKYLKTRNLINELGLNTVCIEANCPNRYECFSNNKATFMILGNVCTRNCLYCNVKKGLPKNVDPNEPKRISRAIKILGINYAVITSVTRDDLKDGGAEQFVKTIREIKRLNKDCKVEVLIPDFNGDLNSLKRIVEERPDVINHNIEVVRRLFNKLRPKGDYELSLKILKSIKEINPKIVTKSGFMVGFGENKKDIVKTIKDLKRVDCDILTVGQYLRPSKKHFPVKKYYSKREFEEIKNIAEKIGFKKVFSGFLVRSSYKASEFL